MLSLFQNMRAPKEKEKSSSCLLNTANSDVYVVDVVDLDMSNNSRYVLGSNTEPDWALDYTTYSINEINERPKSPSWGNGGTHKVAFVHNTGASLAPSVRKVFDDSAPNSEYAKTMDMNDSHSESGTESESGLGINVNSMYKISSEKNLAASALSRDSFINTLRSSNHVNVDWTGRK